ncbi:hypothetical protein [Peribacillus sp. SCS-155]
MDLEKINIASINLVGRILTIVGAALSLVGLIILGFIAYEEYVNSFLGRT